MHLRVTLRSEVILTHLVTFQKYQVSQDEELVDWVLLEFFFVFKKKSQWRSKWLNGPMVQFLFPPTFHENPVRVLSQRQIP